MNQPAYSTPAAEDGEDIATQIIRADADAGMTLAAAFAVGLLSETADAITDGRARITLEFAGSPYEPQTRAALATALATIAQTIHAACPTSVRDVEKSAMRLNVHKD